MAKDPAFLFYPNDWIGGTMGMTFEEKGAYMEILMMQFNRGHMTSHMVGQTVGQLWVKIEDKFIKDENGLWYNKRLDEEILKRKNFTESRRNNISGTNQYTKKEEKKTGHKDGHMTSHMENENNSIDTLVIEYTYSEFYDFQIELSQNNEGYLKFVKFIFGENETGEILKGILSIPKQLTFEEFCTCKQLASENKKLISETLLKIENDKKYYKGKKSLNLTLKNWLNDRFIK
jgi:uncharacterized protein YdaU (DUF1376 family)